MAMLGDFLPPAMKEGEAEEGRRKAPLGRIFRGGKSPDSGMGKECDPFIYSPRQLSFTLTQFSVADMNLH